MPLSQFTLADFFFFGLLCSLFHEITTALIQTVAYFTELTLKKNCNDSDSEITILHSLIENKNNQLITVCGTQIKLSLSAYERSHCFTHSRFCYETSPYVYVHQTQSHCKESGTTQKFIQKYL